MGGKVELEQANAELVRLQSENREREADARAHALRAMVDVLKGLDARSLQALTMGEATPETLFALGFQTLADNAERIGEFNFSPDLLHALRKRGG
jgi:hypothetical protein